MYSFAGGRGYQYEPLKGSPLSSDITVTWAPSSHQTVVHYQLQYRREGTEIWINATYNPLHRTVARITNLVTGARYQFRHVAVVEGWKEISEISVLVAGEYPKRQAV